MLLNKSSLISGKRKKGFYISPTNHRDGILIAYVIYVFDRVNIIKNVRIVNCILVEIRDKTFSFK